MFPGQTMSLISKPSFSQDFQTPICKYKQIFLKDLLIKNDVCFSFYVALVQSL